MLRAIIIDDEEAGIETLKILASRNTDKIRVVASTMKPEEGITLIEDYKPDVVFLDISMPTMTGFELLTKLVFKEFKLIFTTAYSEYALAAIKSKAYDYLLKPISNADFTACLNDLVKHDSGIEVPEKKEYNAVLDVQVKDGIMYLKQKEIIRLVAARSYTEIFMDGGIRHVASKSLVDFERKLDPLYFYRCHKSHIVNLQKVQKFINHDGFYALMSDGSMADVSKNNKDVFLELLKNA